MAKRYAGGGYRLSRLHPLLTKAGVAAAALAVALTVAPAPAMAGQPSAVAAQQIAKAQQAAAAAGRQCEPTTVTVSNEAELRQAVETIKTAGYGTIVLSADINLSSTLMLQGASFDLQLVDTNKTAHTLSANPGVVPVTVQDAGLSLAGGAVKANGATAIQASFQSENQHASIASTAVETTGSGFAALSVSGVIQAQAYGAKLTSEAGPAISVSNGASVQIEKGYAAEGTLSNAIKGAPIAKVADTKSSVAFNDGTYTLASGGALFDIPSESKDVVRINGGTWPVAQLDEVKAHLIDHATVNDATGVVTGAEYPGATYVKTEEELRRAIQDVPEPAEGSWEQTTVVVDADIKLNGSLTVPAKNLSLVSTADGSLSCAVAGESTIIVDAAGTSGSGSSAYINLDVRVTGNGAEAMQVKSGNVSIGGSKTALSTTNGSSPLVVDQGASVSIGTGSITATDASAIVANGMVSTNPYGSQGPANELLTVTGSPVASVSNSGGLYINGGTFRLAEGASSGSLFKSENVYAVTISGGVFDKGHNDEIESYLGDGAAYDPATGTVALKGTPAVSTEAQLRQAIDEVPENGRYSTIQVENDITLAQTLQVSGNKSITLTSPGCVITGPSGQTALEVRGEAKISMSGIALKGVGAAAVEIKDKSLLTVSNDNQQDVPTITASDGVTPVIVQAPGDSNDGYLENQLVFSSGASVEAKGAAGLEVYGAVSFNGSAGDGSGITGDPVADVKKGGRLSIYGGTFQRADGTADSLFTDENNLSEDYNSGLFVSGGYFLPAGDKVATELAPYLERTNSMYDKKSGEVKPYTDPVVSDEEALRQAIADAKEDRETTIYVASNIQLTDALTIPANRTIRLSCQNGAMVTLSAAQDKSAFLVEPNANLSLGGISLKGNSRAVLVLNDAKDGEGGYYEGNTIVSGGASEVSISCDSGVTPIVVGANRQLMVNGATVSATGAAPAFEVGGRLSVGRESVDEQSAFASVTSDGPIAEVKERGSVSLWAGVYTVNGDKLFTKNESSGSIEVTGGTFKPMGDAMAKMLAPYLRPGYRYNTSTGEVGEAPCVEVETPEGQTSEYQSLSEALKPENSPDGSTVTILRSFDEGGVEIEINRKLTIKGKVEEDEFGVTDYTSLYGAYFTFEKGSAGSKLEGLELPVVYDNSEFTDASGTSVPLLQTVLIKDTNDITVSKCKATVMRTDGVSANMTAGEPDKACIRIKNSSNIVVENNEFYLDPLTRTDAGFKADAVAVDVQGSKAALVDRVTLKKNSVSIYYSDAVSGDGASRTGDCMLLKANGDASGDFGTTGVRGVSDVNLTENTIYGSNTAYSGVAELSAVNGALFQENAVSNIGFGVRQAKSEVANTGIVVDGGSYSNMNNDSAWIASPMNPTVEDTTDASGNQVPGITYKKDLLISEYVTTGNHGKVPDVPVNTVFAGWYSDSDFVNPRTDSDNDNTYYAKFVPISDVIKFQGGSLRMDLTGKDGKPDYSKTNLRFGYVIDAPGENASWKWKLSFGDGTTEYVRKGENMVEQADGRYRSNVVITGITSKYYAEVDHAVLELTYTTPDGTPVTVTDAKQSRSVKDVVEAILAEGSDSKPEEKGYAQNLKDAMAGASEAA